MSTLFSDDDLKKLVLKCDHENNYNDPTDMINNDGTKNYAYVTLVMLGDKYISAALVLAYSLRLLKTKADLVVLVTNDVSDNGINILKKFYDHIIPITYINISNWRTKIQPHRKYLDYVFTKFHIFNLTQYKKVLLIDADAIIFKYPDHLFSLSPPAGCYLSNKELFITYDNRGNYILPANKKIKWYEEYCDCCGHGKIIPKNLTDNVACDEKNSGIGGGLMLLEPKKGELDSILDDVSSGIAADLVCHKFVWPEQQYLTWRYSGKWTGINPLFYGLQGYPHWKVLYGLQYAGDKPFVLKTSRPIKERLEYPDYILWHTLFRKILDENKEFKNELFFQEVIQMNKLFENIDYKIINYIGGSKYYQEYIKCKNKYLKLK